MIDVCFNVLHYQSFEATSMCVDSLLKLKGIETCLILILDNGSPNDSFELLRSKYSNNSLVKLQHSNENLGFSEGNNRLYCEAKAFAPQFIIALNNDIEIRQVDFIDRLQKVYASHKAYVIGPDVYCPREQAHQSPLYRKLPSKEEIETLIIERKKEIDNIDQALALYHRSTQTWKIRKYLPYWMIEFRKRIKHEKINILYKQQFIEDPVLQGSCIIVTRLFMRNETLLFTPDTGFYCEELILALRCKLLGYKALYAGDLRVIHWHGLSSGFRNVPSRESLILKNQRLIKAYSMYVDLTDDNPWTRIK